MDLHAPHTLDPPTARSHQLGAQDLASNFGTEGAADTSCGFRVCGGDNQLYECTSGGWVSAGGSPCNCRCTNGVNSQGQAINPDHTYCNYQVCGSDHQIYKCTSSGWSGQGTACQ